VSDGPELTPDDVQEILRLIDESEYDEFELETPRLSIRFSRHGTGPSAGLAPALPAEAGLVDVPAPLVGTVYRGPRPGEPPFVDVGSRVDEGTQLCIIEVMKLMHSVASPVTGIVAEACVENGAAVGYGDVLFRIEPDA
jgi:multidrug efflux pump subunit AcrA (membrane-fusion protein)